jgi:hypothetical protein
MKESLYKRNDICPLGHGVIALFLVEIEMPTSEPGFPVKVVLI